VSLEVRRLKARARRIQNKTLETKKVRSILHDELYKLEVEHHLQEQSRIELEGLHCALMDIDELVFENSYQNPTEIESQTAEEKHAFSRENANESLNATANVEAALTTLENTLGTLRNLEQTKKLFQTFGALLVAQRRST